MIKILFFAALKERLGLDALEFSLTSEASVAEIKQQLLEQNPSWQAALGKNNIMTACNQVMVKSHHRVQAGDELAFFPPVTGG